jgi:hypothetical protein
MKFYSTYKLVFQFFATVGLMAGLFSCEKENNTIPGGAKAVVEAYLVPNRPITVKVKKQIAYNEDLSNKETFLSGLNIKITAEGQTYTLKPFQDTLYKSDNNVIVKVGVTYNLAFDYNGKTVSASTIIPTKPTGFTSDVKSIVRTRLNLSSGFPGGGGLDEPVDINLTWSNPNNNYFFVAVNNIESSPVRIVTLPNNSNSTIPRPNFTSSPVQGTGTRLRSPQFEYFGSHNLVLLKVNPDYVALYNTTGTTSQNISTPPTSITNGLGIFTGVNGDTLSFVVRER